MLFVFLAGYDAVDAKAGHTLYTEYQQAPRAKIFRRDQGTVSDLPSMQHMMRYTFLSLASVVVVMHFCGCTVIALFIKHF